MPVLCSIVICTYNYGLYLPYALSSITTQDFDLAEVEVVIINDGSTDNTDEVIQQYKGEFPNVKYHKFTGNRGKALAMKKALSLCTGEYVLNLDADDVFYPNKLKVSLQAFLDYEDVSMVSSNFRRIDEHGKILDTVRYPLQDHKLYEGRGLFIKWLKGQLNPPICFGSNLVIRKSVVEDYLTIIDGSFGQTIDTFLQALGLLHGKIIHINEELMGYRQHRGSLYLSAPSSLKRQLTLKSLESLLLIDKVLEDRKLLNSVMSLLEMNKIECNILPKCTLYTDFIALINIFKHLLKANYVRSRILRDIPKALIRKCLQSA